MEEGKKEYWRRGWKIGDICYANCCCGPEFKILDLTYGYAIISHLPPVAIPVEHLFKTEKELLSQKLEKLKKERDKLDEQIKFEEEELEKVEGQAPSSQSKQNSEEKIE